jgi:hypothetical protein
VATVISPGSCLKNHVGLWERLGERARERIQSVAISPIRRGTGRQVYSSLRRLTDLRGRFLQITCLNTSIDAFFQHLPRWWQRREMVQDEARLTWPSWSELFPLALLLE